MLLLDALLLSSSLALFLYGFFPIPTTTSPFTNNPPEYIANTPINSSQFYKPHFKKTVLMIIDALRWDFVTPELMPLTTSLMQWKGCLSEVLVESPTVTLPRIKALTTGSVPQYLDIIRNLASPEVLSDSWLHSAKAKGLQMVFYGDNTWEKLFPGFFTHSEGTTSFFVWDFSEVDNNVTRNVEVELERLNWDVMILHYLGLDHIGHVLGPFSEKIPPKLKEMDKVIYKIYTKVADSLVLVTGDHGMRDTGGHGGTSHSEVTVPLIALGLNCQNSSFKQTDIPVNLAILLGLNIPSSSIGKVQRGFLNILTLPEYLYAIRYNLETLLKKTKSGCHEEALRLHEEYLSGQASLGHAALSAYENCSDAITERLYEASSKQNITLMLISSLLLVGILLYLVATALELHASPWEVALSFAVIISSSFQVTFLLNVTLLVIYILYKITRFSGLHYKPLNTIQTYAVATCISHPLTFISTSFIEEEHYFWTFFSITLLIVQLLQPQKSPKIVPFGSIELSGDGLSLIVALLCLRFSMDLNSTIENTVQNDNNWANLLNSKHNYLYHQTFFAFNLFLVFSTLYSQDNFRKNLIAVLILCLIFLLKSLPFHSAPLGQLIWALIFIQKLLWGTPVTRLWILISTLLLKPHNTILVPMTYYIAHIVSDTFQNVATSFIAIYTLSNSFYFLQGHRNSLATVDVSVGYVGLNNYYPSLVIIQVLAHTYALPVLFYLILFKRFSLETQKQFWSNLLALRASVVLSTCLVTFSFRHHLFVWSVFAPKLIIESVHTTFLFVQIVIWHINKLIIY
ncbi:GPI ethanolamine phosphate transferase 2-like [Euwallacea similis]|uniref:GPI ethanolamine phosphate transferase 2-like n=1 Tax=Euwallacea similis TaxID=1736056 RepID=UPI00344D7184